MNRKILLFLVAFATICSCGKANPEELILETTVTAINEFGAAVLDVTMADMENAGFGFGDEVSISSDDIEYRRIPLYSGFYVKHGEMLLVESVQGENISLTRNYTGVADEFGPGDKVSICLKYAGAYDDVERSMRLVYSDDRAAFASDYVFANAREVKTRYMKEHTLFRSSSPFNNSRSRAEYAAAFARDMGIRCVLDLADAGISDLSSLPEYSRKLVEEGCVIFAKMGVDYESESFKQQLCAGLTQMAHMQGPYLIHCQEGKDRTGFVCMLIEKLCSARTDEIEPDYMVTYDNYYGITASSDPVSYKVIMDLNYHPMMECIDDSFSYMLSIGMKREDIDLLRSRFMTLLAE